MVVSSNSQAPIIDRVHSWNGRWGFDTQLAVVNNQLFPGGPRTRGQSEQASEVICNILSRAGVDLVLQLGYMIIANDPYVTEWGYDPGIHDSHLRARALNWHPGLLPLTADMRADDACKTMVQAYRAGQIEQAGHTVHVLARGVDAGPAIATTAIPLAVADTAEDLQLRLRAVECAVTPYIPEHYLGQRERFLTDTL